MGKYKRLSITLPEDLVKQYQKFCSEEGIRLSSRIAILLKKDLKK